MIAQDSKHSSPGNTHLIPPLRAVAAELAAVDRELSETIPESFGLISKASRMILRAGGKRMRPALVLLSARAFSPHGANGDGLSVSKRAIMVAGALEMIHGASLLHDDVVDNAQTRRGNATVGAWWSNKIAVMLGDYLFTRALLDMCGDENHLLVTLTSEATGRMVLGQVREIEEQNNFDITVDDYLFIIREKTAVLLSAASRMGAIVGSANRDSVEAMAEFGMHLGMAFQIVDDVLDFWGDEELLGKPVGSDLSERKFTLPFIYTLSQISATEKDEVRALLDESRGRLSRKTVRRIMSRMDAVDAQRWALDVASEYGRRAREALRTARCRHGSDDMDTLIDYVLERRA